MHGCQSVLRAMSFNRIMQKIHPQNLSKRAYLGFFVIGILCGFLGIALIVYVVLSYQLGEASAYASTRASSMLKVASRDSDASRFWFFIGAWCFGAILFWYLAYRFIQLARLIRSELRARNRTS